MRRTNIGDDVRSSNAGIGSTHASVGESFQLVPDAAAIEADGAAENESPVKPKKVGYLRAKFSNFLTGFGKTKKRRRYVQNILEIE